MDTKLVLNTSFNELVFEKRHKKYGAYQIRKRYGKNVLLSALIASGIFISAFASYFLTIPDAVAAVPKDNGPVIVTVPFTMDQKEKKPDEPLKPLKPKSPVPPAKGSAPASTPEVTKQPVDMKTPSDTIGNPQGVKGGSGVKLDTTSVACLNCQDTTTVQPPKPPVVIDWSSHPPVFPGDIDAFFQRTIRYPQMAKEAGIEGTVWLSWIVDTKGNVSDVQVIKGSNPSLDKEALRAAKLMPAWTPGKTDEGEVVNFRYRKPVRFTLVK